MVLATIQSRLIYIGSHIERSYTGVVAGGVIVTGRFKHGEATYAVNLEKCVRLLPKVDINIIS